MLRTPEANPADREPAPASAPHGSADQPGQYQGMPASVHQSEGRIGEGVPFHNLTAIRAESATACDDLVPPLAATVRFEGGSEAQWCYPRKTPPVCFFTFSTILPASASKSSSVSVRSVGWMATSTATDFLPSPRAAPS